MFLAAFFMMKLNLNNPNVYQPLVNGDTNCGIAIQWNDAQQ